MACSTELLETLAAKTVHRVHRGFQEFARIEFAPGLRGYLAERRSHRQSTVGIDIDLADAMLDAADDFLDWNAPGLRHLATKCVEDVLQRLRHRRRTVHHQMRVRQPAMDFLNHMHGEDLTVRLSRKFVGAVRGP